MNEYLEVILENIKRSVGELWFKAWREIKEFFLKFSYIIEMWGWEEWTLVGFFSVISLTVGLMF